MFIGRPYPIKSTFCSIPSGKIFPAYTHLGFKPILDRTYNLIVCMTLFLRLMELTGKVYASILSAFSQIFSAINQRELVPVPVSMGAGDRLVIPYTENTGRAGADSTLIPSVMKKSLLFLGTFLSVLILSFAFSTTALGQATVTSDKPD